MNTIKNYIRSLISNSDDDKAILSLTNLVVSDEFLNECFLIKSAMIKTSNKERLNTEYSDKIRVERSQNTQSLLELANKLPEDRELIENRVRYAINVEEDYSVANDIIMTCFNTEIAVFSEHLNFKIENYQLNEIEINEDTGIEDFMILVDQCGNALLERLNTSNYYDGHGVEAFISNYLGVKSFIPQFFDSSKRVSDEISVISPYFDDINSQKESVRRHLLLWEEKFLTGDYKSALERAENARLDELSTKSINYEYTLITYIKCNSVDKIISNAIKSNIKGEFEYVLLLASRSLKLEGKSTTIDDSLMSVYYDLSQSIKKIYNNIDFSYLLDDMERGRSKKREYIKRLVKIYIDLIDALNIKLEYSDNLPFQILRELDGVNKYPWISLSKGQLVNRTNFNALRSRINIIKRLEHSNIFNPDELYLNSSNKLNETARQIKDNLEYGHLKEKEYLSAVMVLDSLYGVSREENLLLRPLLNSSGIGQNTIYDTSQADTQNCIGTEGDFVIIPVDSDEVDNNTESVIAPSELVNFSSETLVKESQNEINDNGHKEIPLIKLPSKEPLGNNERALFTIENITLILSIVILFLILIVLLNI